MKSLALASALSLALVAPALAMDCASKKQMQNAEAETIRSEQPAEAAAAQTPVDAGAAQAATEAAPAEVAEVPAADPATTKN